MTDVLATDPAEVEAFFRRSDDSFHFARWGRPIAPVVFGVEEPSVVAFKSAFEAIAVLAGHRLAETDPELGANLMVFAMRDWNEMLETPNMDRMIPGLEPLVARLTAAGANQYRVFRFDEAGAIKACFVLLRVDAHIAEMRVEDLALGQAAQSILLWSDRAFADGSPLVQSGYVSVLKPVVGAVIRASYDPALPVFSQDASLALRLAARMGRMT